MACCCPPKEDVLVPDPSPVRKLLHGRHCTDVCCLLLFVLALGGAGLVAAAAFEVGNPGLLKHGQDYAGALCGVDEAVLDKPKVYYPRLAQDLVDYQQSAGQQVDGAPRYLLPIYAVCVAECPEAGETIEDYGCTGRRKHPGCKWERNPLARGERVGQWKVGVGTKDVVNRCLPYVQAESSEVRLCAMPSCTDAKKPCYSASFEDALYWTMETADDRANCLRAVDLSVS